MLIFDNMALPLEYIGYMHRTHNHKSGASRGYTQTRYFLIDDLDTFFFKCNYVGTWLFQFICSR